MKLKQFTLAALILAGSLVVTSHSASALRVRTVPHSEADQKKKEEQKSTTNKTEATPASVPIRSCSQSQILKTTAWVATGSIPE